MNANYVQTASFHEVPGFTFKHPKFVNLSSQQLNPGRLPQYFLNQSEMGYNPVRVGDIPQVEAQMVDQINADEEVPSSYKRAGDIKKFWNDANRSNAVLFRTQSMRAWGVPLALVDLHMADANF